MDMCRFSLVAAFVVCGQVRTGLSDTTTQAIDHFIILVHPCPYEALGKPDDDAYRTLERAACQRWFDAIRSLRESTFVIQIDGAAAGPSPGKLHEAFVNRLGSGHVVRIPVAFVSPEDPARLQDYYRRIDQRIRQQMAAEGLTFDPAVAKATIWGQSFEGCASGFGSAVATGLDLATATQFEYRMSAPDAPFLLKAEFLQTVAVPASDIEAYVFDLRDGRFAAFFRSCLTPQWLDYRPIMLQLDAGTFSVLTKNTGTVVWPQGTAPTAEQTTSSRFNEWRTVPWPPDTKALERQAFILSTVQERYVVGPNLHKLIAVIKSAKVTPQANSPARGSLLPAPKS
jgi:hypothetical protein